LEQLVGVSGRSPLALLTGGARDLPARQRTLRAALDWSYDLLGEAERRVFRRLSVFVGGCTLDAAEAACGPDAIEGLASLVDSSLLRRAGELVDGQPRYLMLETVREYGAARLETSGEAEAARRRHAEYSLHLAEVAEPRLSGPEQADWLNRLEAEHDNLRAALAWTQTEAGDAAMGLRLARALWGFWLWRGYVGEGRRWLRGALDRSSGAAPAAERGEVLHGLARLAYEQSAYDDATALWQEALALGQVSADVPRVATSLHFLALVAWRRNDYQRARALAEEGLLLRRDLGDPLTIGESLNLLGNVARAEGDADRAAALLEEALVWLRQAGNARGIAVGLDSLGNLAHDRGDHDRAVALFEESLALRRDVGDKRGIAWSLHNLGAVARAQGDLGRATALLDESLALFRDVGVKRGIASSLHQLGLVARAGGDDRWAAALHEQALALYRDIGQKPGVAACLKALADSARAPQQGR
jgi:tetratricopeptide (TPR) repeat protein